MVRIFWWQTYNTTTAQDFQEYVPAAAATITPVKYGDHLPRDVVDLDFSAGFENSRWNALLMHWLHDKLPQLHTEEGSWGLSDVHEEYLLELLWGQLKHSWNAWAQKQPKFSQTTSRFETNAKAAEQANDAHAVSYEEKCNRSRHKAVSF